MIHTSNSFFTLLILFTFLSCAVKPADPKTDMEANYKQLVAALHAKDADALKSAMSKVAYVKIKNAMLSAQAPFPETLFESVCLLKY